MIAHRTLLLALLVATCASSAGARVVLIGVDGAGWPELDPLLAEGALPNLAALARSGVTAELETVEPLNSPTVWTSIATGRSPEVHGVRDFFKTSLDRRVPTVFERLAVQGRRVGLLEYLVTWPPETLPDGFVVPGWLRRDESVAPPDLFARAGHGPGSPPYRYSLLDHRTRDEYLAAARGELAGKAAQWNRLAGAFDVDLGAVTFYALDNLSHRFYRDAHPDQFDGGFDAEPDPARAGLLREAVTGIDVAVGEIRAALDPEDTLLVVSDHGFQAMDEPRRLWSSTLEPVLAEAGLVPGRDGFSLVSQFTVVLLRVNAGPFVEREPVLERVSTLLRSIRTSEGAPLYTVDVFDMVERPPGKERPLLERVRSWITLRALVWFYSVDVDPNAHAYVLARPDPEVFDSVWPDGAVRVGERSRPAREIAHPDEFTGNHHPIGVFLAAGGPIRALPERDRLSVLDVAPLLAHLAGGAIPDDLEGTLPERFLEPEALAARPPRTVDAASLPRLARPDEPGTDAGDEALYERLRTMGYVE